MSEDVSEPHSEEPRLMKLRERIAFPVIYLALRLEGHSAERAREEAQETVTRARMQRKWRR